MQDTEMSMESLLAETEEMKIHTRDVVVGEVVGVNEKEVFVNISGYKFEGVIPLNELAYPAPANAADVVKVGDQLKVYVMSMGGEEGLKLSKVKADNQKFWDELEAVFEAKQPVKAEVTAVVKGGVTILACGARGFVPASQLDLRFVEDMKSFVGQTLEFMPIEFDKAKHKAVFSRRVLLEAVKKEQEEKLFETLEEGQSLQGVVKRIVEYGVFVDIGGVDGLVHISELSWQRVKHPSEVVKVGDKVEVIVKSFDREAKRISLSLKSAQRDPWFDKVEAISVGQVVEGKVVKTLEFGAFVNIGNDLEGLVHLSELSDKRVAKTEDAVRAGDVVQVKIIRIDMDNKKIGLSIKQVAADNDQAEYQEFLDSQQENKATIGDAVQSED